MPPQESVTLHMAFVPPKTKVDRKPGVLNLKHGREGQLKIQFSTGQPQTIELNGHVLRPMIVCAPSEHSFGIVHVEALSEFLLFLSNPTGVEASWKIVHVPVQQPKVSVLVQEETNTRVRPLDEPSVFNFSEWEGSQKGPSMPLESSGACLPKDVNRHGAAVFSQTHTNITCLHNEADIDLASNLRRRNDDNHRAPRPITVTFQPKKNLEYQSRFRFEVAYGEGFDVVLSGKGTYEEDSRRKPEPHIGPGMHRAYLNKE
uniref:Uncharacterized protein n=1 Tax=Octactis speculum TaxID=3111310 RepID=A0A7S2DBV6_9STRA